MKFNIPTTVQSAGKRLIALESLATATEWERAAIVATFTEPSQGRRTDISAASERLTFDAFASKGFAGLTNKDTIARYYDAWVKYSGLDRPVPGEKFEAELPDWSETVPARKTKAQDIAQQPGAVAAALENPAFVKKVRSKMKPRARSVVREGLSSASDEFKQKAAHSAEQQEASQEREGFVHYHGYLYDIIKAVKVAAKRAGKPGRFKGDNREFLLEDIAKARAGLDMLEACIKGDAVDWDDELEKLTAGEVT